jgi:VanZ family protein
MVVIFSLSALPGSAVPGRFGSLGHFAVYAVLGSLYLAALDPTLRSPRAAAWAVALASAYGVTDEFHQLFVPGRKSDPIDWLVDTAGALFAVLLVRWAVRGNRGTGPEAPGTDTRETDAEVGGTAGAARPGG